MPSYRTHEPAAGNLFIEHLFHDLLTTTSFDGVVQE